MTSGSGRRMRTRAERETRRCPPSTDWGESEAAREREPPQYQIFGMTYLGSWNKTVENA